MKIIAKYIGYDDNWFIGFSLISDEILKWIRSNI